MADTGEGIMSGASRLRARIEGAESELPPGYTVTDASGADNRQARKPFAGAEPEPLRRAVPPPQPYPVEALGNVLGRAASALHKTIKAPLALCGQSVLAAASLAVQPHADVLIDGRRYPTTLWLITIAESGERKSAVDSVALAAHKSVERERIKLADQAEPQYQAKAAAYEAALKHAKAKNKTVADIAAAIESLGPMPEPPPRGILLAAEPTVEAIQKIYLTGVPSLGLFSDEGATFFGGHSMSQDHALRSVGALSKLWDDGTSDRLRATDGQRKLYGRRLAMHLMMQPVVAEGVLSNELLIGQGFLARCLLAWPSTTAGSRDYVADNPHEAPDVARLAGRMFELLQLDPRLVEGRRGELEPRGLTLSRAAKETWRVAYDEIERHMAPTGGYSQVRPWASKAAEQVLRMAGVLTLVANSNAPQIEADAIKNATQLVAWHMCEVVRLVDTAKVPDKVKHAEAVLAWCRARGLAMVDSTTLLNRGPNSVRSKEPLDAAMEVLVEHGWAESRPNVEIAGRKVRRAWAIRGQESQESQESQP